jgi:AraC-like DNA-binding protein
MGPEAVASKLNIGYSWFRRVFKEYTGLAPAQYQLLLKIQVAKEWLMDDQIPIKDIAFRLNFNSHFHFSNIFAQKTGLSPSNYRKISLGKVPGEVVNLEDEKNRIS